MTRMQKNSKNGFALLVVIMVLLLTSFMAAQLIMQVRTEQKVAFNAKSRAAGYFLSEAGISLGMFRLKDSPIDSDDDKYERFLEGHTYEETLLPVGKVSYYAVSESGKIDLNSFPRKLLELFLEYHQPEPEQVATIVDSLMDWRDTDDMHRLNGAEEKTYRELDDPYVPRNGKIEDPSEFFLVYGTEALAGLFVPEEVFTAHNPKSKINFNSLTPAMLDFLVEGDPEKRDAYEAAREELVGNQRLRSVQARQILGDERFQALRPYLTYSSGTNRFYSIVADGRAGTLPGEENQEEELMEQEGQAKRRRPGIKIVALIEWKGNAFQYVSWQERYS